MNHIWHKITCGSVILDIKHESVNYFCNDRCLK